MPDPKAPDPGLEPTRESESLEARPARPGRAGLFVLAFGAGFAVLTIEIAGARLIAPVFGLSVVPWTAVIGVVLGALAIGSHVGGRLADAGRVPLSAVLTTAGLTGALPVVGGGVPWAAREALGFIPGAVGTALVLFAPPVLCLGAVVPYLVQADTESLGTVGRRAGDVSAAATAGSIAGSFGTGFVLLPALPLPLLLAATAAGLLLMAALSGRLLGGRAREPRLGAAAAILLALGALASGRPADTLYARQTLYSSVEVTEREWADGRRVREMWQNGGSSSAEYVDTGQPAHGYAIATLDFLGPALDSADAVLVLGGAALSLPVAFQDRKPEMRVDVVEIDPVVTELAAEHFSFGERPRPGIAVVHEDARVFLRRSEERYDVVYLDVFDHLLTVPWTMVTVEALSEMSDHLERGGVFGANVLSPLAGPGTAFLERFRRTLEEVFPAVRIYLTDPAADPAATQNLIVVAARSAADLPVVEAPEAPVGARGAALTDAWAPVEYLQALVFVQGLTWN